MANSTNVSPKVLIPFYSRSGTVERLAKAVAEGAESEGAEVRLRRARELVDWDIMSSVPGWKESAEAMNARYPAPTADDAVWADAVIFGTPTRFGNVSSELKAYIDSLGGLWAQGKLVGKAGSVFAGSSQQHGGNETTVVSLWNPLAHLGFIIVPDRLCRPGDVRWCGLALWRFRDLGPSAVGSQRSRIGGGAVSRQARGASSQKADCSLTWRNGQTLSRRLFGGSALYQRDPPIRCGPDQVLRQAV